MGNATSELAARVISQAKAVDGLLGLDFLRGQRLEIDFARGVISLT